MRHSPINGFVLWIGRLVVALVFSLSLVSYASGAMAQDAPRSASQARNMFERGSQAQRFQRPPAKVVKRSRRADTPTQDDSADNEEPAEKHEDARVVLVVGDFMAYGLAAALTDDYAQSAGVKIVDATNGSSGLVRTDFYDWPKEIGAILDSVHPAVVVVMIGANDRQVMDVGTTKEPPRSDAWTTQYVKRVEAVAKAVTERKIHLLWVGQPAFKYTSMSSDMLAFDDIYQRAVEAVGGDYVDIWDGFVDENGAFRFTGPDVNGQSVRLRSDDGITLSKAGKRKVAFYVEKPLNKVLGSAATSQGSPDAIGMPGPGPDNRLAPSPDRTAPISLAAPPEDGNADLLGAKAGAKPSAGRTAAERLTIDGIAPGSPLGRADDFSRTGRVAVTPRPTGDAAISGPSANISTVQKPAGAMTTVDP